MGSKASNPWMELLEIQFDVVGSSRVTGSVAADERHHQPWGRPRRPLHNHDRDLRHHRRLRGDQRPRPASGRYQQHNRLPPPPRARAAGRHRHRDPPGAHPAALASRDPPTRRRQARRPRPGPPPEHRPRTSRGAATAPVSWGQLSAPRVGRGALPAVDSRRLGAHPVSIGDGGMRVCPWMSGINIPI
jgi:hypothetical protein